MAVFGINGLLYLCLFLAFVRSGNVNINDGRVNYVGEWGWDWSRTSRSSTNAYNLQFGVSDINPSNNNNRWNGFSLRWGWPRCGADL